MTITDPSGAVSTKCADSFGAAVSDPSTMRTVYAGPHILTLDSDVEGENMWISGIYPPWGSFSLMRASDISQVENSTNWEVVRVVPDIAVRICWRWESVRCISRFISSGSGRCFHMFPSGLTSVIAGLMNKGLRDQDSEETDREFFCTAQ